jgi:N-acetylmuramic acid 6-phosphate etherase
MSKSLFEQLALLSTEQRNEASMLIDTMSVEEILAVINREDHRVPKAVQQEIPHIAQAVYLIVDALSRGGRLIYAGAGTSGRLGVLDAVECPPTFGTDPEVIQGIIAGGPDAMFHAQEGAEDSRESGAQDIDDKNVGVDDVVCGIAASLRTPYVSGAIQRAKERGARTIFVTSNPRSVLGQPEFSDLAMSLDVAICADVGPEVIMGSTRMKSGTAQKLVLNMLTSTAMIQLGKVYENMMVDLQLNSDKLKERAKRVIVTVTGVSYDEAERFLKNADGHVKTAVVMIKAGVGKEEAKRRLQRAGGFVRKAIAGVGTTTP